MIFALVLAAAAQQPLFVAPAGMHQLKRDPIMQRTMAARSVTWLREYHKSVRKTYGAVSMARSITITIASLNAGGLDAGRFAAFQLHSMTSRGGRLKANHAVQLCRGGSGWLTAVSDPRGSEMFERLYAASGATMYVAMLQYPRDIGDFGAAKALTTLCPPATVGERLPVKFAPPSGWTRLYRTFGTPENFDTLGQWMLLPQDVSQKRPAPLERVVLLKGPPLPEKTSPQDRLPNAQGPLKLCNGAADGYFVTYTRSVQGRSYIAEEMSVFTLDAQYVAIYQRDANAAENAQARAALNSLCP